MAVRLGAIYALERISKDSRRDYWTIMETLTAYVRERAPWPPRQALGNPFVQLQVSGEADGENTLAKEPNAAAEQTEAQIRPETDIQAVLTVLGRRLVTAHKQDEAALRRLDLAATDLRGADLEGAHLERAVLREVVGLTQEQLEETFGDATTKVADELRPPHWRKAAPDMPDNSQ